MKRIPKDVQGRLHIKLPVYWADMLSGHEDGFAGRLYMAAINYAFDDESPEGLTDEQQRYWEIMKRDIDFQSDHPRSYRYREETNQEERTTAEYKQWREAVYQRDGYRCRLCGQVGGILNAHHILPFAGYPQERTNIKNGITLCKRCHTAVHRGEMECPTGS
jgi:predicted restriction endonuclease